jgi:hypothetical protein
MFAGILCGKISASRSPARPPGTGSIFVDGSDVTQVSYTRAGLNLSNEVVQEAIVITSGLSAKYGRTGGGVMSKGLDYRPEPFVGIVFVRRGRVDLSARKAV